MEDSKENSKDTKKNLKEEYTKLQTKYSLPSFEDLDKDFQIEDIDPEDNILRELLEEIHDSVDFYSRLLENLIQPDSKLCDMKEAGNLTKEDQENIMEMYRTCMLMNRSLLLINLDYNEQEAAEIITKIHKEWQDLKLDLKTILTKMKNTWIGHAKKETYGGYYG